MKNLIKNLLYIMALAVCFSCSEDNDGGGSNVKAPQNISASVNGTSVYLMWAGVYYDNCDYSLYVSDSPNGYYSYISYIDMYYSHNTDCTTVYLSMSNPGTYYFKIIVSDSYSGDMAESNVVAVTIVDDTGGNTGGNTGDDTGGNTGDDTGGNTGGDTGGNTGGETIHKPSAPTGVHVANYGSVTVPDVRVTWNSVSSASGYYVYRSSSASGTYSKIGTTSYERYVDNTCKIGKTYYYKVKAYNSAGASEYSDYCKFEYKDTRKPGPVTYGNCTVSGTTMTMRWSAPTGNSYGKPTKALLKVKNPDSDQWATLEELPGTATSVSFTYTPWVGTSGYTKGYLYVGIILENENGTGGGTPKIWDNVNKKWVN